jgi:hypothetical protein
VSVSKAIEYRRIRRKRFDNDDDAITTTTTTTREILTPFKLNEYYSLPGLGSLLSTATALLRYKLSLASVKDNITGFIKRRLSMTACL